MAIISLAEGSPWMGANLLTLLRQRKAQLPTTREQRIAFWLSGGRELEQVGASQ